MAEPDRERLRREHAAAGWLGPWLHLLATAGSGVGLVTAGALLLHDVRAWQLGFAAAVVVVANAIEHWLHKRVMHHRLDPVADIYRSHSEVHHVLYRADDMAIRSVRELPLVLLKPWAVLAAVIGVSPGIALFWLVGQRNLAALLLMVSAGYVLGYELLHLAYHLPGSRLGKHHVRHHDPRLMQRGNFNVSIPLWDLVSGTRIREERP